MLVQGRSLRSRFGLPVRNKPVPTYSSTPMSTVRTFVLLTLLVLSSDFADARTLVVVAGGTYARFGDAARDAAPGDTILIRPGVYAGGEHIIGLQGTSSAWITVRAESRGAVIIRGGGNAWQLTDPAYLRFEDFVFEGQTGNGINIDDGGTYDTPAHHVIFDRCDWRALSASGNNDQLKLSGLDSFEVRNCTFTDGATGGSSIDMVGCHYGVFTRNTFTRSGSNAIQAKGATRYIRIERNTFIDAGERAINIGGSTGLQFFRPIDAKYESANIGVYSNVFVGSTAPIAYVGTINSEVVNNTIILPKRWTMRILQETTAEGFVQCGDNAFRNNIVLVDDASDVPTVNEGPNTRGSTFLFTNNLWYHVSNPSWSGPNLPSPENGGLIGRNPLLEDDGGIAIRPGAGSPAIGAGASVSEPQFDYFGRAFASPRSIGAVEVAATSTVAQDAMTPARVLRDGSQLIVELGTSDRADGTLSLFDVNGRRVRIASIDAARASIDVSDVQPGIYLLLTDVGGVRCAYPVLLR